MTSDSDAQSGFTLLIPVLPAKTFQEKIKISERSFVYIGTQIVPIPGLSN